MMQAIANRKYSSAIRVVVSSDDLVIETINTAEQIIHRIELSEVSNEILIHRWTGYRTSEQFKDITDGHFIELFEQHKCKKILVDISNMTGTFASVNNWMAEYLMPKLMGFGFRASAVILPKNIFVQLSAQQWEEKTTGFVNGNFDTNEKALPWLRQQ